MASSAVAASCRCSSVVFVGNVPYHATVEELRSACEEIGPVVSLRVAVDGGTGRPRGFAFCEYRDDETALSACRNLHGRSLRGRELRVGLAERSGQGSNRRGGGGGGEDEPVGVEDATHAASLVASAAARPRGAVTAYLAGLSRRQLRELLDTLAAQDAALVEDAKRVFAGLATLIEQAQALLDMASSSAPDAAAGKRKHDGGSLDPGGQAQKLRRLEDGPSVKGVACR